MTDRVLDLPEGVPPLNTYYAYLTAGCNLACRHCWISPVYQPNGGTGGHLDFELFKLAIEEGLPLGLGSVKLTGGEPLLHPDFIRFVDLIRDNKLNLTIETNGVLMTPELARYLRENSTLRHISVSLDGATAATHDPFRGVKGSFEKACQGIRALADVGYRPQVIMSLHAGNVHEIEALVALAESLGAGSVKFNLVQPSGRGEVMTNRGQVLDIQKLIELGTWVEGTLQKQTPIRLHYSWPMAFNTINRLLADGRDACGIFNILGILSTGHLAMCGIGMQVNELCYGMIGNEPIKDIWAFHPMLRELRQNLTTSFEGVCSNCIFSSLCLGSCVASNYQLTGQLNTSFWFCQMASDMQLFPASRLRV